MLLLCDVSALGALGALVLGIVFGRDSAFRRSVFQFLGLLTAFVLFVGIERVGARIPKGTARGFRIAIGHDYFLYIGNVDLLGLFGLIEQSSGDAARSRYPFF
nr:hypothetical protein TQ38_20870 [Novosphingobium sp. P6W]